MNNMENIVKENYKADLEKAKEEQEIQVGKEETARRKRELAELKMERAAKKEALKTEQDEKEKERLSKPQEIFAPKGVWNVLDRGGEASLTIYPYGRNLAINGIVVVIGDKKGQVIEAEIKKVGEPTEKGAVVIVVKKKD